MGSILRPYIERLVQPGSPFEVVRENVHDRDVLTYRFRPDHLRQLIAQGLGHGDREFLVQVLPDGDIRYTYREAFERALGLATGLRERYGIAPGDRVAILGANAPDWVVAFWAIEALDAVAVPFNAWWRAEELAFGIEDSGTTVVIADPRRATTAIEAGMAPERVVVWGRADRPSGTVAFDDLVAEELIDLSSVTERGEDTPAGLFYTSGTTGKPKASANTHRNILVNLLNLAVVLNAVGLAAEELGLPSDVEQPEYDSDLLVIPLFHATALMATMIPFVYAGNRLVFMPPGRFDPEVAADIIERERVTRFGGVPTVVNRIIESGVWRDHDFSSVTTVSYGGAPASPALLEKIAQAFPRLAARTIQGYGLTETSPVATLNVGPDYLTHPASVGIAVPTIEIRIEGPDGEPAPAGVPGEILLRGSNVIPGYWNRPEANDRAFTDDGYFRTGDVGYLDEDGFLYLTDRAKDMVIRGGENVYCVEVENLIEQHPAVLEVAVVGVPHPDWGEEVKAVVVVRDPDAVTPAELTAFASEHLASFKVPTIWELRTEPLPRNPSGKVLKAPLRGAESAVFAVGEASDSAL